MPQAERKATHERLNLLEADIKRMQVCLTTLLFQLSRYLTNQSHELIDSSLPTAVDN